MRTAQTKSNSSAAGSRSWRVVRLSTCLSDAESFQREAEEDVEVEFLSSGPRCDALSAKKRARGESKQAVGN